MKNEALIVIALLLGVIVITIIGVESMPYVCTAETPAPFTDPHSEWGQWCPPCNLRAINSTQAWGCEHPDAGNMTHAWDAWK